MEHLIINDVIDVKDKRKLYNDRYTAKNLEKLSVVHKCESCSGKYSLYNKAHHIQTKKHISSIQLVAML